MERREFNRLAVYGSVGGMLGLVSCNLSENRPIQATDVVKKSETTKLPTPSSRDKFHHPVIEGKVIDPTPYLTLPFRRMDLESADPKQLYDITEGWNYSQAESQIHGATVHAAIDLHVPYGTPVLAPVDGFAMSSYHAVWVRNQEGQIRRWQGKEVGLGLGYFIQMYVPSANRFVQIAHLSEIDQGVPFSLPIYSSEQDHWNPTNHTLIIEELTKHPMVAAVRRGEPLGRVGFSGLRWGKYEEYRAGEKRPIPLNPEVQKSWDEPHVHYEDMWRSQSGDDKGTKGWQRDMFDVYSTFEHYPTPTRQRNIGIEPLLLLDQSTKLPLFAA